MTVSGYVFNLCVRGIDFDSSTIFLLDFETVRYLFCFSFIMKVLLDNVLSIIVELWVKLQVKLGNKNT